MKQKDDRYPRWKGSDVAAVITSICNGAAILVATLAHVHG